MADWRRYLRDLTELAFHIFIPNLSGFSGFFEFLGFFFFPLEM